MAEEEVFSGPLCGNCCKPAPKALVCSKCKKATYCSPACQKQDWQYHRRLCKKAEEQEEEKKPKVTDNPMEKAEMRQQMEEMTKDQDPAMAAQVQSMMAGMMGIEPPPEPPKPPEPPPPCQSCAKACSSKPLRCGKCKTATYCRPECQKEDWRFHKRICKAPAEAGAAGAAGATAPTSAAASTAAPSAAGGEAATSKGYPARPKAENEKVVVDEDVGKWYKHRDWKPGDAPQECAPQRLATEAAANASGATGVSSSAWNAAGTWEEKNMMPWWRERLEGLKGQTPGEDGFLQLESVADLQGEASIVHVRGQPKFMYDIKFGMPFTGLRRCKPCSRSSGSRCSNCVRFAGKLEVTEFSWDCGGDVDFEVKHVVPAGPDHVKKADSSECRKEAELQLQPALRSFLADAIGDYKRTVAGAAEAQKWASQLPPTSSTWDSAATAAEPAQ